MAVGLKYCKRCGEEKPIEEFSKVSRRKDGLCGYCKSCMNQYNAKYRQENKEKIKLGKQRYRENNHDKIMEYSKEYLKRKDVIERRKQNTKKYLTKRYKKDELFRFKAIIRSEIYSSFKRKQYVKSESTEKIIGCCITELIEHLKQTYYNNYGEEYSSTEDVHIDHIIPLATAKTEDEVKRLCHFTNLQLLKSMDNLHKNDKLDWHL